MLHIKCLQIIGTTITTVIIHGHHHWAVTILHDVQTWPVAAYPASSQHSRIGSNINILSFETILTYDLQTYTTNANIYNINNCYRRQTQTFNVINLTHQMTDKTNHPSSGAKLPQFLHVLPPQHCHSPREWGIDFGPFQIYICALKGRGVLPNLIPGNCCMWGHFFPTKIRFYFLLTSWRHSMRLAAGWDWDANVHLPHTTL